MRAVGTALRAASVFATSDLASLLASPLASTFALSDFAFGAGSDTNFAGCSVLARTDSLRVGGSGTMTLAGATVAAVRIAAGTVGAGSIGRFARAGEAGGVAARTGSAARVGAATCAGGVT